MAGFLSDTTQKGGSDGHDAGCQKPCIKNGFLDPIIKDHLDSVKYSSLSSEEFPIGIRN